MKNKDIEQKIRDILEKNFNNEMIQIEDISIDGNILYIKVKTTYNNIRMKFDLSRIGYSINDPRLYYCIENEFEELLIDDYSDAICFQKEK